jgi:hypothetical protein
MDAVQLLRGLLRWHRQVLCLAMDPWLRAGAAITDAAEGVLARWLAAPRLAGLLTMDALPLSTRCVMWLMPYLTTTGFFLSAACKARHALLSLLLGPGCLALPSCAAANLLHAAC